MLSLSLIKLLMVFYFFHSQWLSGSFLLTYVYGPELWRTVVYEDYTITQVLKVTLYGKSNSLFSLFSLCFIQVTWIFLQNVYIIANL